jgi:hypothetical protein
MNKLSIFVMIMFVFSVSSGISEDNAIFYSKLRKIQSTGDIIISENRGATWSTLNIKRYTRLVLMDKQNGIYLSTNRGATWHNIENTDNYDNNYLDIKISPNPAREVLRIECISQISETFYFEIISVSGLILNQEFINLQKGENIKEIDINSMIPGIFIVRIHNRNYSQILQFIKIK